MKHNSFGTTTNYPPSQEQNNLKAILFTKELLISYTLILRASIWEKEVVYIQTNITYSIN
jgi:hypothetical protein